MFVLKFQDSEFEQTTYHAYSYSVSIQENGVTKVIMALEPGVSPSLADPRALMIVLTNELYAMNETGKTFEKMKIPAQN